MPDDLKPSALLLEHMKAIMAQAMKPDEMVKATLDSQLGRLIPPGIKPTSEVLSDAADAIMRRHRPKLVPTLADQCKAADERRKRDRDELLGLIREVIREELAASYAATFGGLRESYENLTEVMRRSVAATNAQTEELRRQRDGDEWKTGSDDVG